MNAVEIAEIAGIVSAPFSIALGKVWADLRTERRERKKDGEECDKRIANVAKRLEDRITALEASRDNNVEKRIEDQRRQVEDVREIGDKSADALALVVEEIKELRAELAKYKRASNAP